jgi:GNAT superfamily N-acetyltransferase
MQWRHGQFEIDSDPDRIDFDRLFGYLKTAYWSTDRSFAEVRTAWEHSSPVFGVYSLEEGGALVGCCRVVTDTRTFAWLADVYLDERFRGNGIGKFMVRCVLEHPDLARVRQFLLATSGAHGLYHKFGWEDVVDAKRFMVRRQTPED